MTTIVRAAAASDFLSLVPELAGYVPARSLVLVPFRGTRSIGLLRVDLPEPRPDDPAEIERVASTVIGMVCRIADADALTPVVYADRPLRDGDELVHARLVSALRSRADACGLAVLDALCVARDGWASYLDPDAPVAGHPLAEIDGRGAGVGGDQSSGSGLPRIGRAERSAVGTALRQLDEAVALLARTRSPGRPDRSLDLVSPLAIAALDRLDDLPGFLEDLLDHRPAELSPFDAAALLWCLERPALRDVALSQWALGQEAGDIALAAQLAWQAGEEYPEEFARHMWGEGPRPDPARLQLGLDLCRRTAASAPKARRAGALAAAGWSAWALGRSTHAAEYARRALQCDAEHGLAQIVESMVAAGHLPDWAFHRQPE